MLLATSLFCQQSGGAGELQPNYSIVYSGRMFGYLRDPDVQQRSDLDCSAKDQADSVPSPAAKEYLERANANREPNELRVAVGDNFSPELLSRNMYDPAVPQGQSTFQLRSLYTPAKSGGWLRDTEIKDKTQIYPSLHGVLPSDNVACFIKEAQFQAVVPGKEDFYFGPERLNEMARFLAKNISEKFPRVEMLATNLIVVTSKRGAANPLPVEELPKEIREALTQPELSGGAPEEQLNIALPGTVLPWLHRVEIKGLPEETQVALSVNPFAIRAELCRADDGDPNKFLSRCEEPVLLRVQDNPPPAKDKTYFFDFPDRTGSSQPHFVLQPGTNEAVCLDIKRSVLTEGRDRKFCKTFHVAQPFLQVANTPEELLIGAGSPRPYYVGDSKAALQRVAVFGVVAADLQQQVGLLNSAWLNTNADFSTTVGVMDPGDSLIQLMQVCDLDPACRDASKVLLAQMPLYKAKSLISDLKGQKVFFDAVVTAIDTENVTGNLSQTKLEDKDAHDPFYIVPAPQWDANVSKEDVTVRYQRARLFLPTTNAANPSYHLENQVNEYKVKPDSQISPTRFEAFSKRIESYYLKQRAPSSKVDGKKAFEYLALQSMLNNCNADVALIQPRDVFDNFQAPVNLWPKSKFELLNDQNLIDEILWKGDFAICKTFTGASLKSALKQSANANAYLTLASLGVKKDDLHDNFVIHGEALDDKKIYSVALTGFLAFGDTGYKDLAGADLKPADTINTYKHFKTVASLAASSVFGYPVDTLSASTYFDKADAKPADQTPGFNRHRQVLDWFDHWIEEYPFTTSLFQKKPSPEGQLEYDAQRRHLWFLNVEKLNVGYNLTFIGGRQQDVPNKFADIYNVPKLQTLESSSWSAWGRVRGGYQFPEFLDIFGVFETRYGNSKVRSSADPVTGYNPYSTSINDNAVEVESGILTKRIAEWMPIRILVSERVSTQLFKPLLSYTSNFGGPTAAAGTASNCTPNSIDIALTAAAPIATSSSTASVSCAVNRSVLRVTKYGARLENRGSWVESGWENGTTSNSPYLYTFNKGTANEVNCPLAGNQDLSTCIANLPNVSQLSPLYVSARSVPVIGWFLNFRVSVPLKQNDIQLVAESYGEIFNKNNLYTNADTRLYDDVVISLPVRIFQNLSLAPQVEFFYFKNQVNFNHFFSSSSSITFDYSFDYHRGVTWGKAARYPDADTVTKRTTFAVP